jgi:hypothetical protein
VNKAIQDSIKADSIAIIKQEEPFADSLNKSTIDSIHQASPDSIKKNTLPLDKSAVKEEEVSDSAKAANLFQRAKELQKTKRK